MNRISIVIPMFDEARHIARTLAAAREAAAQAGLACELVVVDNGSHDQGPALARALGARVLRLPGLSIGALRNRGTASSQGEWLAFLDADVEVPAHWLVHLLRLHHEQRGDVFALACDTPSTAPWYAQAWQRRTWRSGALQAQERWLTSQNLLMRRCWFERVGGFDERLSTGEDKDFTWRLTQAGARLTSVRAPAVVHWGFEGRWGEWLGKELWRQGGHLRLLRQHAPSLRLWRFPLLALGAGACDLAALLTLVSGQPAPTLALLAVGALPALALGIRQSLRQRDALLTLQLCGLHWLRLRVAAGAVLLSLCNRYPRRPARG
ncbi:glycosyltransferase family 2 protein [Pseudomonas phoenicis]|uniref:glycosyltransferase family 2 protein n=1 Tax=unclassified Pseudomonas TaxID=196821 RepID=UPI0039A2EE0E